MQECLPDIMLVEAGLPVACMLHPRQHAWRMKQAPQALPGAHHACTSEAQSAGLEQGVGEDYVITFSLQLRQGLPTLYNSVSNLGAIVEVALQPGMGSTQTKSNSL